MVQGLVVSGVLAGSALISTQLIKDQKKLSKGVETRDQIEQLHRMVYATFQNREHCMATLAGAGITTATLGGADRTINQIFSKTAAASTQEAFRTFNGTPGTIYMNGNVNIQSMRMIFPKATDPAGQNVITYPSKIRVEYARLEGKTDPTKRTKDGYGAKRVAKDIPIMLQRNPSTNAIDGCYAVQLGETINGQTLEGNNNLNQEFCSNLGSGGSLYVWDSAANKCVLKNNVCPDKFIFGGIASNGNALCYEFTNYMDSLVDTSVAASCSTTSGATVSLTTGPDGKVRITCTPTGPPP